MSDVSIIKNFDLEGIKTIDIKKLVDERGYFSEIIRKDWLPDFKEDWIKQANLSYSYPGIIRAWHRHSRGQIDYFLVLKGAVKIVAYYEDEKSKRNNQLVEIVTSEQKLQLVCIPGYYWHGTKTLGNENSLILYFVNNLYKYDDPDEERRPWNDTSIKDPNTGLSYDWNYPPHK